MELSIVRDPIVSYANIFALQIETYYDTGPLKKL